MQLDNLKDVLQQKLAELESQAVELTAAVAQRQHLLEQVEQLQSELAACRTQLASERRRAEEEQKNGRCRSRLEPGSLEVGRFTKNHSKHDKLNTTYETLEDPLESHVCSVPFRMPPRYIKVPGTSRIIQVPGVRTHGVWITWIRRRRCSWPEPSRNEPHGW